MLSPSSFHFSTIDQMVFSGGTTTRLLMACAMGSIVGLERESRHKASGLRTNMLICMGSAMFTMLSLVIAGETSPNRGQIASNIVQGIGFLGAGLILHTRSRVLGLTSAATVWVVAAIGMACGTGLYVEAAIATAIVYVALQFVGLLESRSGWKRYPMLYEVRGSDEKTMFDDIFCVLDRAHIRLNIVDRDKLGELERVTFTVSANSVHHKQLIRELLACDATDKVAAYRDEEED
jgi:putative Mg2+ transporter-C (MgtC) family protein